MGKYAQMKVNPEIITKLSATTAPLWAATHDDGSGNRINSNEIIDAATVHISMGIIAGLFEGIKKAFRNRGKTKDDFAAEKEAAKINTACVSSELMLRDYLRAAATGDLDQETLDDAIDSLNEIQGYEQAGKLNVLGKKELNEICQCVAAYTSALTGAKAADVPSAGQFRFIRDQLIKQREAIQ